MTSQVHHSNQLSELIYKLRSTHQPFFVSAVLSTVMGIFFLAGIFLDPRYITGAPAWLKPLKFALSISIYSFTLLWFLSFVDTSKPGRKALLKILGWVLVLTFAAEWVGIITQVIRGTSSHFNVSSPFDTFIWSLMGGAIFILFIANVVIAALLLSQKFYDPVLAWGLRLGLIITIVGLAQGYLMVDPTAQQMAGWKKGEAVTIVGAHSVGVEDGGPGLPGLNWSMVGGDLRIGHFVGMHALQVLPLIAWFVSRRRLATRQQVQLVWNVGLGYLGLVVLVTWQALRGQSILAPDILTLSVFAGIVLSVLIATLVITRSRPSQTARV